MMRVRCSALVMVLMVAFVGSCGRGGTKKLCTDAADKYEGCIEKILGQEAARLARSKRGEGIPACVRDDSTVKMYKACLPKADCEAFMKCLEDYAAR